MIINRKALLLSKPIKDMLETKEHDHGVSYGLSEAGYDIRVKQRLVLTPENRFTLASTVEEFDMPDDLVAVVHDKSTHARRGISVFNTVIEPGWKGFLTLEIVYHGNETLVIDAGTGIAQVLFHKISNRQKYSGKYQNQPDNPVEAIMDGEG